jgi:glyoxylase-like metal-dependent hydrolase (beta-lactamase superfamily II)
MLTCHLLDTGYCLAFEPLVMQGGRWRMIACHSVVALLGHPRHGWTLWDAGYSPRLLEVTRSWPYRLYRWATPLYLRPEQSVAEQLPRFGLTPRDIRRVIVSHFHADHIAGLADFPLADILALREAVEAVRGLSGWQALRRAFIPQLLPADFDHRCQLFEAPAGGATKPLEKIMDVFGDGLAQLVALPGHARGQVGLLARTDRGPFFFLADACWLSASARWGRQANRVTNLIVDSAQQVGQTLQAIRSFTREEPDWQLLPTHCPEAFERYVAPPGRR